MLGRICCGRAAAFGASPLPVQGCGAAALWRRPCGGYGRQRHSTESAHMHTRATFAGLLALVVVALVAHGCSDSVTPERSAHRAPAPALDAVPIAGQELYVPPGFNVNLFAEALNGPRSLALGPGGAVFVT